MSEPTSKPSVRTSALRTRIEHLSDPIVQTGGRAPRWLPLAVLGVLLALGVAIRGAIGAVCFLIMAALVGWLLYLAWPRLESIERMMRCSVLLLLAAIGVVMLF